VPLRGRDYGVSMRVEASREAADFVRARGGRLWVWGGTAAVVLPGNGGLHVRGD